MRAKFFLRILTVLFLAIGTAKAVDFDNLVAFPNPVQFSNGNDRVTFQNIPSDFEIKIFDMRGRLVFEQRVIGGSGSFVWFLDNNDGRLVATGVYIYVLESFSTGEKERGKLALIR